MTPGYTYDGKLKRPFHNGLRFAGTSVLGAVFFASMLFAIGCADDPSPVGSVILPPGDLVNVDSVIIVASSSKSEKAIPFPFLTERTSIAIGTVNGFSSWGFLQFFGFPDSLSTATLQSATIHLQSMYHLGDSLGQVSMKVHQASVNWNSDTFVFDSLSPVAYVPSGVDVNLGPIGDNDQVLVPLDISIVREWILSVNDTSYKNYGVVLEPTNITVIKGFHSILSDSSSLIPLLTVAYTMSGSSQTDTLSLSGTIDKFVAGAQDTTFLADSAAVTIRGGAAYRGILGFSIAALPAHAAIHRAYLDVTIDNGTSLPSSNQTDSFVALYANAINTVQPSTVVSIGGTQYQRFTVTQFVQGMILGGGTDIRLAVKDEMNGIGAYLINGSGSIDPTLRPRITVLFSPPR